MQRGGSHQFICSPLKITSLLLWKEGSWSTNFTKMYEFLALCEPSLCQICLSYKIGHIIFLYLFSVERAFFWQFLVRPCPFLVVWCISRKFLNRFQSLFSFVKQREQHGLCLNYRMLRGPSGMSVTVLCRKCQVTLHCLVYLQQSLCIFFPPWRKLPLH